MLNKTRNELFGKLLGRKLTAESLAYHYEDVYLPVTQKQCKLLYLLARSINAKTIIEIGTSFGVSTIYLAAAVKDNGGGQVITTELSKTKIQKAQANFANLQLNEYINVLHGDALETLRNFNEKIDLLLIDGWKNVYLPVLKILENNLRKGAIILADNISNKKGVLQEYYKYVNNIQNGYQSLTIPLDEGFEYSIRV